MRQQLYFQLDLKPFPYPNGHGSEAATWGQISIIISGDEEKVLFVWQWNFDVLVEWFDNNRKILLSEELSICGSSPLPGESLAQADLRLRNRDFPDDEDKAMSIWYEELQNYGARHSLIYALEGANVPDIIIGLNRGIGEISRSDDEEEWAYQFDMNTFCEDLAERLKIIRERLT